MKKIFKESRSLKIVIVFFFGKILIIKIMLQFILVSI